MTGNIKAMALGKMAGFKTQSVIIEEWGGIAAVVREPSAEAWLRWQALLEKEGSAKDDNLDVAEQAKRNLKADVTLFIDILYSEDLTPVFTLEDASEIEAIYGPVHSRLLKVALNLTTSAEIIKKK